MANIETALRSLVIGHPSISPILGGRFYWDKVPDAVTFPFVRASIVNDKPSYTNQGSNASRALIQLDVQADTKEATSTTTDLIVNSFKGYRGAIGPYTGRILVTNVPSSWETGTRLFRRIVEMDVGYAE